MLTRVGNAHQALTGLQHRTLLARAVLPLTPGTGLCCCSREGPTCDVLREHPASNPGASRCSCCRPYCCAAGLTHLQRACTTASRATTAVWMAHQPTHEESPALIDGPGDLGSSSTDTESRQKAEGQHQQSPSGQEQVNETNASTEEATPTSSTSASTLAPTATPTPTGQDDEDKGEEASEVGRGGSAVRGGKRPPRPPGSIRQGRKDKRKAGWEAKKALVKEKKRAAREQR